MSSELYSRTLYSPGYHQDCGTGHTLGIDAATSQEIQTLARITELEDKWRRDCDRLTLWQRPLKTMHMFFAALANFVYKLLVFTFGHQIFRWVCLPISIIWILAEIFPGPHTVYIKRVDFAVEYVVWWVGLGVLSSIGLGSGLQTGVLFMFPHIIKVCLTAEACRTTNFESFTAIWFRVSDTLFTCPDASVNAPPATYLGIWKLVILPSFLQSAGTAIGEIPPYWLTKASRLAEIQAGERAGVPEELQAQSQFGIVNRIKSWLFDFLASHGFMGVFLMASWPNFAFDLCGICCGHFLMPFWTFFGATLIGKAVVRNTYQTLFMVAIFNEKYMEKLVSILQGLVPDYLDLDEAVRQAFEDIRSNSHTAVADAHDSSKTEKSPITLSFVWGSMMTTILCLFLVSCIQQFAQFYQTMLNGLESERLRSLLSTRQLRSVSASNLRRSPAADLLFSGNHISSRLPQLSPLSSSAAKQFADRIESRKEPKYDLVYLSTGISTDSGDDYTN